MFQKFGQNFDPSKPSKSKDTAVLSWGIFQKKNCRKFFKNLVKAFSPSKASKSKDTALLSQPSKSKDTVVLSWGIKKKNVGNVSKISSKL